MQTVTLPSPRRLANRIKLAVSGFSKRRFSLHLTVEGWCLVVTMLLIGLAALNTAAPLLYLLFSMMCSFFVLSALLASNTIRGITVRRSMPRVWQAQVPLRVELRIRNSKLFTASYSLRVNDRLVDGSVMGSAFFDFIPPRKGEVAQDYECVFRKRGAYRLRGLEVATRFPFGLIERVVGFKEPLEILVLPQTITVSKRMREARVDLGDFSSNQKGLGSGLYGLRNYTPEFPARDIHWKLSARRGNLIVREYESEERRRAVVVLDNRVSPDEQDDMGELFEKAIVLSASVVEWLCETKHEVELRTASGIIGFGSGMGHVTRCRRCLARLEMVEPDHGDAHLLFGGTEGNIVFPILMYGRETRTLGRYPVNVEDFEDLLNKSFRRFDQLENGPMIPPGEEAARV